MEQLINKNYLKILRLFYNNRNASLHLREISRNIILNESSVSRHLNYLEKAKILDSFFDANLKKFKINKTELPRIFPVFDDMKLEKLPLLRRNAIKVYLEKTNVNSLFVVVFGSTAKGTFNDSSDVDLLEIVSVKNNEKEAIKYVEAQTGLRLQIFRMTEIEFRKELKDKKDAVVQAAIKTGFPVYNQRSYYELILHE